MEESEWISVKERLPERYTDVLVWRSTLRDHVQGLQSRIEELQAEKERLEKENQELREKIK